MAVLKEANAERFALTRARKAFNLRMEDIALWQEHLNSSWGNKRISYDAMATVSYELYINSTLAVVNT
jgi:hypothetical protein